MREYGGYIELDDYGGEEYHKGAAALNCGRNCLACLIEARHIRRIMLPRFLCPSMAEVCEKRGLDIVFYNIDRNLRPVPKEPPSEDCWFLFVNYYGQFSDGEVASLKERFGVRLIADYSQSFFQRPLKGVDTIYTCRKFFGVPDGAYLYADISLPEMERDVSYGRMGFLLGRYERTASEFYPEYVANNKFFASEPPKAMSKLTRNLLRGIDYERVESARTRNFEFLDRAFSAVNKLDLKVPAGAFMYPLLVENGAEIRRRLQAERIYIPTLWPEVLKACPASSVEYDLAANILPLPCDQRYNLDDMAYIAQRVLGARG